MRILIVDDEPMIRSVCARSLGLPGTHLETAASADEALPRLQERWDLVITDVAMPGRADGVDLLRRASEQGVPVVVMTAYPDLGSTLAALKHHASGYLVKPFTVEELRQACVRHGGAAASVDPSAREHKPQAPSTTATALFADVRGFSRFAASSTAGEAAAMLAAVLSPAMAAVQAEGGAVQQVLGDGFLALFGGGPGQGALAAARAAVRARYAVWEVEASEAEKGRRVLPLGFGLETGEIVVQALGNGPHGQPTFVGHAINTAARLEKAAPAQTILAGPEAAARLAKRMRLAPFGQVRLCGADMIAAVEVV